MGLDGISVNQLAKQLNKRLCNCNIDKIQQPDRYDLLITFRAANAPRLLLSANPAFPIAFIGRHRRENPLTAPGFCMFLRKHLGGARLLSVECPSYERLLRFRFIKRDELGDLSERSLIIEMTGRYSNIIVLDADDIIMESLIHIGEDKSRYREILPARPYLPPPPQDKPRPAERLAELYGLGPDDLPGLLPDRRLDRSLLQLCLGLSPQTAKEILFRSELEGRRLPSSLDADERGRLYREAVGFLEEVGRAEMKDEAFYYPEGNKGRGDFHLLKLETAGPFVRCEGLNEAISMVYRRYISDDRLRQKRQHLEERLMKTLSKKRRLWEGYHDDMNASADYEEKRFHAELLLSQLAGLPERLPEDGKVWIIDYYDPEQRKISLTLDPRYTTAHNANRLFKRYNKERKTYAYAAEKAEETKKEIDYLESLLPLLEHAESLDALDTVAEELGQALKDKHKPEKQGAKRGKSKKAQRREQHRALPPRRYTSSDGLTILAGRNNYQNDSLSFRSAKSDDLWFHAKNRPGSHVILRLEEGAGQAPERSIEEAAEIAAWLSRTAAEKQQGGADMEIDFCPVSHLRKPRGAKPGFVVYDNYRTIRAEARGHEDLQEAEPKD